MDIQERLDKLNTEFDTKEQQLQELLSQRPSLTAGDILYLHKPDVDERLSWIIAEIKGSQALLLPADDFPLAGTRDVKIGKQAICGPLTVCCSESVTASLSQLNLSDRIGVLEDWLLERVQNKLAENDANQVQGSVRQQENDEDPDYQAWRLSVKQSRAAMARTLEAEKTASVQAPQRTKPKGFNWGLGLSLAFNLMLAAGIVIMFQQQPVKPEYSDGQLLEIYTNDITYRSATPQEQKSALDELTQEDWLDRIAELVLTGQTKAAKILLAEYEKRFPQAASE